MSEVRVTTLKDTSGSNSSTTAQIASGRSKAWVNFNGVSTVAIRSNFNVNSITDNGTGDYTANFSTALADANYSVIGYCGDCPGAGPGYIGKRNQNDNEVFASGSFRFGTGTAHASGHGMANFDGTNICINFFR